MPSSLASPTCHTSLSHGSVWRLGSRRRRGQCRGDQDVQGDPDRDVVDLEQGDREPHVEEEQKQFKQNMSEVEPECLKHGRPLPIERECVACLFHSGKLTPIDLSLNDAA